MADQVTEFNFWGFFPPLLFYPSICQPWTILNVNMISILFICAILTPSSPSNLPIHLGIFKQEESKEETRGAATMALKFLVNIKEKVTCPICLEVLIEPLSLNCGHSFCKTCITNNKESEISPEDESSCPVCGIRYSPGNLWLNQHLANIVEKLKEVKLSPEEEQNRDVCVHHGEKLKFFCKEDGKVICPLCECSREHCGHQIFLMEKVVKECQVRWEEDSTW